MCTSSEGLSIYAMATSNLVSCVDPSVPQSQLYLDHQTLSLFTHRMMAFGVFVPSIRRRNMQIESFTLWHHQF